MNNFNLQAHLDDVYSQFPEARKRPVIGITSNYADGSACIMDRYYKQVVAAGGAPTLIPPVADKDVIAESLNRIDALMLTGGADLNPLWQGEEPMPALHSINAERDLPELLITRLAFNRQMPILGICRGIQTLATALGGEVAQDIASMPQLRPADAAPLIKHSQDGPRNMPSHTVKCEAGSILAGIYGSDPMAVNSFHHQAVSKAGKHLHVVAKSPDGVIEAVESCEHKDIIGVQWHPEWLEEEGLKLFVWLCNRAEEYQKARVIHQHVLTLDSHCDTPMFFPQGVDFTHRDPKILVDLHKMTDGMQDVTTMVAYIPQPKEGQSFKDVAPFSVSGPKAYADLIFDKIEQMASQSDYVDIARTPDDLWNNKKAGRKSIMLGIENGLALEHDLNNIDHFKQRGVVYITLCHNGDNDLCDSARGSSTFGGVSKWGVEAIHRMNELGIMVDLSHASEQSFYDALSQSSTPIVCSHSCCKALCDVPRNLSDNQMRALAKAGGVMQITFYHGFLKKNGEASIIDIMSHLEHAIQVMGIEHVGIGTDFDGDGGVAGAADSSELINITKQLLRRRYNDEDISLIWGGNWLRVMRQVQRCENK